MDNNENNTSAFINDDEVYNKKIKSEVPPERKKDVDLDKTLYSNIIGAALNSQVDLNALNSLNQSAANRNEMYNLIDSMCEDGSVSAVVETYAEDSTEHNDKGDIVWCEASDKNVAAYVEYLLDTLNVNKNIFKWTYSLCKYGDVYLRLYRESEYSDELFTPKDVKNKVLSEDIKIKSYKTTDNYAHYMEMVTNPAEMFELTRFGKTVGYIKASVESGVLKKNDALSFLSYAYKFKKEDIEIYPATEFVHAALEDDVGRDEETVNIFLNNEDYNSDTNGLTYKVRRGDSLLSNVFKTWRELNLLQSSVLLNRVTKSSLVRVINVEVGDMPKENVTKILMDVKRMLEQKTAINKDTGMTEYTNSGPIENNIYVPTHGGMGSITTSQIGGDVDVKSLADLEYYLNKFYGQLRVPKQYFSQTDDSTGFNGGTSLTIISSRYAKMIKRIQNTMIQAITDAVNLMLIDKGLDNYVNQFTIHMLAPTTQEEIDRRDNLSNKVQLTSDIMNMLSEIEDASAKLKILKSLLSNIIEDNDIIAVIQDEIDKLEAENVEGTSSEEPVETEEPEFEKGPKRDFNQTFGTSLGSEEPEETPNEQPETENEPTILPSPEDIGVDLTDTEET